MGLGPLNHSHGFVVNSIVHNVDQEMQMMTNIVLGLDNKLLESSHEVLDCFFALFKGKETLFCNASDVRGLEHFLELFSELVKSVS